MTTQSDFREVGEDYLSHFGKMGMKWGHRSSKSTSSSKTTSSRGRKIGTSIKGAVLSKKGMLAVGSILGAIGAATVAQTLAQVHGVEDQAKALTREIEKDTADFKYKDLENQLQLSRIRNMR